MKSSLSISLSLLLLSYLLVTTTSAAPPENFDITATSPDQTAKALPQHKKQAEHETFVWLPQDTASTPSTERLAQKKITSEQGAKQFLKLQASRMGLSQPAIDGAKLVSLHDQGRGPIIARFQQMHNGHEVFSRQINVMMSRNGNPVAASGSFAPQKNIQSTLNSASKLANEYRLDGSSAIITAFADLGGKLKTAALTIDSTKGVFTLYAVGPHTGNLRLSGMPRGKKVYFSHNNRLIPAWYVELQANSIDWVDNYAYSYVISAEDGEILFRKNQQSHAFFSYRVFADNDGINTPMDGPLGNALSPVPNLDPQHHHPRIPASQTLLTLEKGAISKDDPWLADGANETIGNNVDAYLDIAGFDGYQAAEGDIRATTNGTATFDYIAIGDGDPYSIAARNAAAVNLFYVNNFLHNWWYDNGFDEQSGNAQASNFGRGGEEGDRLLAEGQDFSGRNNANMYTPADGFSPRMQMYLFDGPVEQWMDVPSIGVMNTQGATFGPRNFDLTGTVLAAEPLTACSAITNPTQLLGMIALIDRGDCLFADKVANAEAAGAVGVIIANNAANSGPMGMSGTLDTNLAIVSISMEDGQLIRTELGNGPVTAQLYRLLGHDRDGTMDNGIIAHEWFHYVSNRLASNATGLVNIQGRAMGEGWSDFSTIMLQVRPEDRNISDNSELEYPYSTGAYVDENVYFGIRRAPYSTRADIFPFTFKHIENGTPMPDTAPLAPGSEFIPNSQVHASGEIWANVLWNFYNALLNDPRHSFEQAQERMKDYVIAGLKMTPYAPTFLEARNGIWAAVKASDEQDFLLAAQTFAKFGMGVGAVAPDRWSYDNQGVIESFVALAAELKVSDISVDYDYVTGSAGYCDRDGVLDVGESVLLKVALENTGTKPFPNQLTGQVLALTGNVAFSNHGEIDFVITNEGQNATGSVALKLLSSTTESDIRLALNFPETSNDSELLLPSADEITLRVNYDLTTGYYVDSVSPASSPVDWQANIDSGFGGNWQISNDYDPFFNTGYMWYIPDNPSSSDVTLTSPVVTPSLSWFSLIFSSYFDFETFSVDTSWDGGVVEISVNGGPWQDVLDAGGTFTSGDYNAQVLSFDQAGTRRGFGNSNDQLSYYQIDFGDIYIGDKIQFRFRMKSDEAVGDFGWLLDDIGIFGVADGPFSQVENDSGVCVNRPPQAILPILIEADERLPGEANQATIQLIGSVNDLDGAENISYLWQQTLGPDVNLQDADTTTAHFVAPDINNDTTLGFSLTVDDGEFTNTATTIVNLRFVNSTPTLWVSETTINTPERNQGESVQAIITLTGGGDDNDTPQSISYLWQQTSGPAVVLENADSAQATFIAPQLNQDIELTFDFTVSDGELSATTPVSVSITNVESPPMAIPPANFEIQETYQGAMTFNIAQLLGAAADPDGTDNLTYLWEQLAGPTVTLINANQPSASFIAPEVAQDTPLQFQLTVSDGISSDVAPVTVTIINLNRAPTAILPASFVAPEKYPESSEQSIIELSGSGQDPDSQDTLSYHWQQISGPQVTLENSDSAVASFISPFIIENTVVSFSLTVSDGELSHTAHLSITLTNHNTSPIVNAGEDFDVYESQEITTLNGSANDSEHDALSYQWQQLHGVAVTIEDATTLTPSFTTPEVGVLVFMLTVTDSDGAQTQDTISVSVVKDKSGGGALDLWLLLALILFAGIRQHRLHLRTTRHQ